MASFLDLNGNCVTLNSLLDKVTGLFVNDAVVTVTVRDSDDVILVNAQSMAYVAASDGVYLAVIPSTVDLGDNGDIVSVEVIASTGGVPSFQAKDDTVYIRNRKLSGI